MRVNEWFLEVEMKIDADSLGRSLGEISGSLPLLALALLALRKAREGNALHFCLSVASHTLLRAIPFVRCDWSKPHNALIPTPLHI
jgi:hypothetical protein